MMSCLPSTEFGSLMNEPLHEFAPDDPAEEVALSSFDWEKGADESWKVEKSSILDDPPLVFPKQCSLVDRVWAFVEDLKAHYRNMFEEDFRGLWDSENSFNQVFYLVERLAATQAEFKTSGKSAIVDIGYHYTTEINIPKIQERGLLTRDERNSLSIKSKFNGAIHGNGIYLGNNPFAFCNGPFGQVGLLVARLRGVEARSYQHRHWEGEFDVDTKTNGDGFKQMVILRTSRQCVPLASFSSEMLDMDDDEAPGNARVYNLHLCLQSLLDKYFNECPMVVKRVLPSESPMKQKKKRRRTAKATQRKKRCKSAGLMQASSKPPSVLSNLTASATDGTGPPHALGAPQPTSNSQGLHFRTAPLYDETINGGPLDPSIVDILLKLDG